MFKFDFPVDAVYLWCDDNDPNFRQSRFNRELQFRQSQFGNEKIAQSNNKLADYLDPKNRYENHDELKYSLRSLEKYVPWINHVFIVTNKQQPSWLKMTKKLTVIDHSEIIPKELLPTFNSCTIEQYLCNIPNLSEHFIYLNDDMFFNRETPKDVFFDSTGKPKVYIQKPWSSYIKSVDDAKEIRENASPYLQSVLNGYISVLLHRKKFIEFSFPTHSVDAYCKSILTSILSEYQESYLKNIFPFRSTEEMARAYWVLEMAYFQECPYQFVEVDTIPRTLVRKVLSEFGIPWFYFKKYIAYEFQANHKRNRFKRLVKDLEVLKPYHFCCNNLSGFMAERVMNYLSERFPEKSSFEL